ncbi:MAG: AraC family transcriptional regulator [Firmicutes bacterium]|nr:AraC family transcriptional regulator [Bacillota bacterium]
MVKKNRLHKKMFFSYILCLLIPMFIVVILVFKITNQTLIESAEKEMITVIKNTQSLTSSTFKLIGSIAAQINTDKRLDTFLESDDENMHIALYLELIDELKRYKLLSTYIESIYIYSADHDVVLGNQGIYSKRIFFEKMADDATYSEYNKDEIKQAIETGKEPNILPVNQVLSDNVNKFSLLYITPIFYSKNSIGSVVAVIDTNNFINDIEEMVGDFDGTFLMLNKLKNVISELNRNLKVDNEHLKTYGKSRKLIVKTEKSYFPDITYIIAISKWKYIGNIGILIFTIILGIVGSLTMGIILADYFSKKQYKPVKYIFDQLQNEFEKGICANENELELIYKTVNKIISIKNTLNSELGQYKSYAQDSIILSLMKGRNVNGNSALFKKTTIDFSNKTFYVIVFNIDDSKGKEMDIQKELELYLYALRNVSEEYFQQFGNGYCVYDSSEKMAMLLAVEQGFRDTEAILKSVDFVKNIFEQNFGETVTVGVSCSSEKIEDISKLYSDACIALEYKLVMGKGIVIPYYEIRDILPTGIDNALNHRKIANLVLLRKYEPIEDMLLNFKRKAISTTMTINEGKAIYYKIFHLIWELFNSMDIKKNMDIGTLISKEDVINNFIKCETISEMIEFLLDFIKTVCDALKDDGSDITAEKWNMIISFLHSNFHFYDMSLNTLCDRFNVPTSTLSKHFKDIMGNKFIDYLHFLRIEQAKKYLLQTDLPIKTIAENCGYINSHSFIRVFKKYEYMTPGKFKDTMCR